MVLSDAQKAWLAGPEASAIFKAAWHKEDREKTRESRVTAGLEAVAEVLGDIQ